MKKSYHSSEVPIRLATITRRTDDGGEPVCDIGPPAVYRDQAARQASVRRLRDLPQYRNTVPDAFRLLWHERLVNYTPRRGGVRPQGLGRRLPGDLRDPAASSCHWASTARWATRGTTSAPT